MIDRLKAAAFILLLCILVVPIMLVLLASCSAITYFCGEFEP